MTKKKPIPKFPIPKGELRKRIRNTIVEIRKYLGYSKYRMAKELGVRDWVIARWEKGERCLDGISLYKYLYLRDAPRKAFVSNGDGSKFKVVYIEEEPNESRNN